jgi:hypothetical protein
MIRTKAATKEYREGWDRAFDNINTLCRWCKSTNCNPTISPSCYCLYCETRLEPCNCRPDCLGGKCYQSSHSK